MRVLIAPDCWTGTLTAGEAATAMAEGWHRQAPADELDLCPMSDGGPGFLDVLHSSLGGRLETLLVPGPLGDPTPATLLLATPADGVPSAYVESAQACGLHLIPPGRRDPSVASSAGVGALLLFARDAEVSAGVGVRRVVVGLGGSGTNDGGAGMLAALWRSDAGTPSPPQLDAAATTLAGVTSDDLAGLADLRSAWSGVQLVAATDVDVPLLGPRGASRMFGPHKGASPDQVEAMERALTDFAGAAMSAAGVPQRTVARQGAGAAGGLGFGLFLLGADRVSGVTAVAEAVSLKHRLGEAGLGVTGEGSLDWQSLSGKVVAGVAAEGLAVGVPVIAVAGRVEVGRRELLTLGIESAYPVARDRAELAASLADPAGRLADRVARIARTWSPAAG